jgi:membrane-bound ClpP family serine protease
MNSMPAVGLEKGGILLDFFNLTMNVFSFVEGIQTLQAILFIVGLLLLIAEMFMPGFGVAGFSGLVLLVLGIVLTARDPFEAVMMVLILLILVAGVLAIILRSAKKGKLAKKLILRSAARHENGFSTSADTSSLTGKEGIALTILRPAGSGEFDGRRLDVVTEGSFIEKGVKIRIVRTEGRRIVVQRVE